MSYAEKVKFVRNELLLTQEELAALLSVNSVTVCRWETGKSEPSIKAKKAFRNLCERKGLVFNENNG